MGLLSMQSTQLLHQLRSLFRMLLYAVGLSSTALDNMLQATKKTQTKIVQPKRRSNQKHAQRLLRFLLNATMVGMNIITS